MANQELDLFAQYKDILDKLNKLRERREELYKQYPLPAPPTYATLPELPAEPTPLEMTPLAKTIANLSPLFATFEDNPITKPLSYLGASLANRYKEEEQKHEKKNDLIMRYYDRLVDRMRLENDITQRNYENQLKWRESNLFPYDQPTSDELKSYLEGLRIMSNLMSEKERIKKEGEKQKPNNNNDLSQKTKEQIRVLENKARRIKDRINELRKTVEDRSKTEEERKKAEQELEGLKNEYDKIMEKIDIILGIDKP